jgi:hypothetical protein
MQQFFLNLAGTILFFIPGTILTRILFKKTTLSEFLSYSVIISFFVSTILSLCLFKIGIFSSFSLFISIIILSVFLLLVIFLKRKKFTLLYDKKTFWLMFLFAISGTLWRWFFRFKTNFWGDGITSHINSAVTQNLFYNGISNFSVPDVGFYTGMMVDHSKLFAGGLASNFYYSVGLTGFFETFLAVFILSFFTYKVIYLYRKNISLAFFGAFIVAVIGPVEIWQNTLTFLGGNLVYVGLIALFILYLEKEKSFFYLCLIIASTLSLSYYTAGLVLILTSSGFLISFFIRGFLEHQEKSFFEKIKFIVHEKKFREYFLILVLILILFFTFAGESLITHAENTAVSAAQNAYSSSLSLFIDLSNLKIVDNSISPSPIYPYVNYYKFLRISPLNWQNLIILLMGFTFLIKLCLDVNKSKKIPEEDKPLLVTMLPAYILALAFALIHYEQRSFSYLLFFMILIVKIPKKFFYFFVIFCVLFFFTTGYFNNMERIIFYDNSEGEIDGALWVSQNLDGKILSDEKFISLLINKKYYNVTGFPDDSPFTEPIFYSNDLNTTLNALKSLNVTYFISTKRMREKYILMLNFPQQPMSSNLLYSKNFNLVYNNSDVEIYFINQFL